MCNNGDAIIYGFYEDHDLAIRILRTYSSVHPVPKQIFNKDDFIKLADDARECLVVRRDDKVKIKLRRSRLMYIYVTNASEADEVLGKIKVDKIEL